MKNKLYIMMNRLFLLSIIFWPFFNLCCSAGTDKVNLPGSQHHSLPLYVFFNRERPIIPSGSLNTTNDNTSSGCHRHLFCPKNKERKPRTIFTDLQMEKLKSEFEKKQYIQRPESTELAAKLGLKEEAVKNWFKNRRRRCKINNREHPYQIQLTDTYQTQSTDTYQTQLTDTYLAQLMEAYQTQLTDTYLAQLMNPYQTQLMDPYQTQLTEAYESQLMKNCLLINLVLALVN